MGASDPRLTGSTVDSDAIGSEEWVIVGTVGTVALVAGASSHYIQATSFGFDLHSDSVIGGITASIGRLSTVVTLRDTSTRLLKATVVAGSSKALATALPASLASASYGGEADLWDTTWTPGNINGGGFGAVLAVVNTGAVAAGVATSQNFSITVNFTIPETGVTESVTRKAHGLTLGVGKC